MEEAESAMNGVGIRRRKIEMYCTYEIKENSSENYWTRRNNRCGCTES